MTQITTKSQKAAISLEDIVPTKVGNDAFVPAEGKGNAKKLIERTVDDLKNTYARRNMNYDKKQLNSRLKAFKSILDEVYSDNGYGKLAEFCKAVSENSLHNFADDSVYLSVSERFCESMGVKNGASFLLFLQDKIGASISDVSLIFSPELLKDIKKKEEVLRALDAISGWFQDDGNAEYMRRVAFSDLRFALGAQPSEDFSEKNMHALLGALSNGRVPNSLGKIIPRHEFAVFDYFKIIGYAGMDAAEKYAGIIAKNNNEPSFGNVRYMEQGTFRSELTELSSEAVSAAQGGRAAEFEKILLDMEKLVQGNNKRK